MPSRIQLSRVVHAYIDHGRSLLSIAESRARRRRPKLKEDVIRFLGTHAGEWTAVTLHRAAPSTFPHPERGLIRCLVQLERERLIGSSIIAEATPTSSAVYHFWLTPTGYDMFGRLHSIM